MTTGDACQVDRKTKELEVDTSSGAAIHGYAHAGDERGTSRHQKTDEIGNVLGRRDALERIVARRYDALNHDGRPLPRRLLLDQSIPSRSRPRRGQHGG